MSVWNLLFGHVSEHVPDHGSSAIIKVHLIKGIAPVFRDETFLACGKSLLHSVLLTENFCHIFHINQIGVLIRSYDSVEYQKNCFATSKFLKSISAENFLDVLLDAISFMNVKKMIIPLMDGALVNG